jgi:hypothetical protein
LRNVESILNYEGSRGLLARVKPELLFVSLVLVWFSLTIATLDTIVLSLSIVVLFHVMSWRGRLPSVILVSMYPSILAFVTASLFSPYKPLSASWLEFSALVFMKVYGIASTTLISIAEAGPIGAVRVSGRIHPLLHDTVMLFYRVTPQIVEDALVAAGVQRLLGGGVRETLTAVTFSGVRRAEQLKYSLFSRGAGPGRRSVLSVSDESLGISVILLVLTVFVLTATLLLL